jgi:RNA polymerase sigma-70 factor (ECF subfamily)
MDEAPPKRGSAPSVTVRPTTEAESSFELVLRARDGDTDALNTLFTRYDARIRRWAHGRLPQAARGLLETQDLTQETLQRVFDHLETFEPRHPGAFRDYVWTTLWNCIRDIARKHQRRGPTDPLDDDIPGYLPSPLEVSMGREVMNRYDAALLKLRAEDREAIIVRVELGLPYEEVASALGKPTAAAAHMAVSRALVRLAKEMAHERQRKPRSAGPT